jgi:hypothetical protein
MGGDIRFCGQKQTLITFGLLSIILDLQFEHRRVPALIEITVQGQKLTGAQSPIHVAPRFCSGLLNFYL